MTFQKVEIKDICKIKSGKRLPKGADFANEITRYPYIRARDIKAGIISGDDLVFLTEDIQKKIQKYIVNTGDIVITIVGASVGDVGYVKSEFDGFNLTENAVRLTDFDERINSQYLLNVLNSKKYWEFMQQIAGGSAQPKLGIYKVESIPLELPPRDVQDKIASILSSYDNLIENNQKQIKLLEEAAQRIYKEWFVDLRFPGYESTKIVDGVPEGWSKVNLPEIAPILTGKKDANFGTENGEFPFFTCAQEPIKAPSYSFDCDAVILAGNGDFNVKLYRGKFEAYQRTYVFSPTAPENLYLLYFAVKDNMSQLFKGASGSTIKFLTKRMLEEIMVYAPTELVLSCFNAQCEAIQRKAEALTQQISMAQEARDRLLARLMSKDMEVSL